MTRKRIVCIKRPRSARIRTATSRTSASAGASFSRDAASADLDPFAGRQAGHRILLTQGSRAIKSRWTVRRNQITGRAGASTKRSFS